MRICGVAAALCEDGVGVAAVHLVGVVPQAGAAEELVVVEGVVAGASLAGRWKGGMSKM